jgi:hypothetical protein
MESNPLSSDRILRAALMIASVIQSVSIITGAVFWGYDELRLAIMMVCGPFVMVCIATTLWRISRG